MTDTITVGNNPSGVAVTGTGPTAGDVNVTNADGTVSVINPAGSVIDTLLVGNGPTGVAVAP